MGYDRRDTAVMSEAKPEAKDADTSRNSGAGLGGDGQGSGQGEMSASRPNGAEKKASTTTFKV